MQQKFKTETFIVKEKCECGGEYVFDGIVLTSYPPKYPHTCNKCGKKVHLDTQYPSTVTEIKDEVKLQNNIHEYAGEYSHKVWEYLMKCFENDKNFYIGANDVSDLVLNAIIDALQGMKMFNRTSHINNGVFDNSVNSDKPYNDNINILELSDKDLYKNSITAVMDDNYTITTKTITTKSEIPMYTISLKDWITREKNGDLTIHTSANAPWKENVYGTEMWINGRFINTGEYLVGNCINDEKLSEKYKNLTWEDKPICIKEYSEIETLEIYANGK